MNKTAFCGVAFIVIMTFEHLVPDLGSGGLGLAICEHHNITIWVLNLKTREKV